MIFESFDAVLAEGNSMTHSLRKNRESLCRVFIGDSKVDWLPDNWPYLQNSGQILLTDIFHRPIILSSSMPYFIVQINFFSHNTLLGLATSQSYKTWGYYRKDLDSIKGLVIRKYWRFERTRTSILNCFFQKPDYWLYKFFLSFSEVWNVHFAADRLSPCLR